ncbi:hypothetical protein Kassivere_00123 [Pseudomonas phage vB_PpuM-Kassivere]
MTGRPTYEKQNDLDNESKVVERIEKWASCKLTKTGKFAHWDFEAYRGIMQVAAIEFKCRTNPRLKYPTYMISARKWEHLHAYSRRTKKPAILVVQWTDFLGYVVVGNPPVQISTGGRVDRGDTQDIESVVLIDTHHFRRIP